MPQVSYVILNQDPVTIDIPAAATPEEQTALIQSALDMVADAGGGTVALSEGTFEVAGTGKAADGALRIGSNTTFEGAGMGLTTIKLTDGSNSVTGILRTDSGQTLPDGSYKTTDNVVIRNLSIDGNQANTTGEVDGFYSGSRPDSGLRDTNITLDQVEIYGASRYGFDPHEGTTNLTITNSVAHHNGRDGFTIDGSEHVVLLNNVAYENGRHGINIVTGSRDVLVQDNQSFDNGSSGLSIQTGDNEIRAWTADVSVVGGSFDNNARYGIEAKQVEDLTITDTSASANGYHGIVMSGVVGAEVSQTTLTDNNNGGSQLSLKNYVQDFNDNETLNDRVIVSSNILIDGELQPAPTNDLDTPLYDWAITPVDDVIVGTEIADRISAGDGDDDIFGAGGNDTLAGNAGNDVLDRGEGDDLIMGKIGDDILRSSSGYDQLDGGAGFDTADLSNMDSAIYVDLKYTEAQVLTSGSQKVSKKSADTPVADLIEIEAIIGTNFADKLYGSNSNDQLQGGAGNDILFGGSGSDRFIFGDNWGSDTIRDFKAGQDKISFTGSQRPNSINDLTVTDQGSDTLITFGGQAITVEGISTTSWSDSDFIFG